MNTNEAKPILKRKQYLSKKDVERLCRLAYRAGALDHYRGGADEDRWLKENFKKVKFELK